MNLEQVSTRELLQQLRNRGMAARLRGQKDGQHLEADAEHLLGCVASEVLDYPYGRVSRT